MKIKDKLYRIDFDENHSSIMTAYEFGIFMGNISLDFAIICAKKLYKNKFSIIY